MRPGDIGFVAVLAAAEDHRNRAAPVNLRLAMSELGHQRRVFPGCPDLDARDAADAVLGMWLAFAEVPALRVLLGGALVMGAVIADIIGDSREQKPAG